MKYPIGTLGRLGYTGALMVNNKDYTSISIGKNYATSFEIDPVGDDTWEEDISNVMKEPIWHNCRFTRKFYGNV